MDMHPLAHELAQLEQEAAALVARSRARGADASELRAHESHLRLLRETIRRTNGTPGPSGPPAKLTTRELAAAWRKSAWTIRDYAKRNRIPGAVKIGRDWLFPVDAELLPVGDTDEKPVTDHLVARLDAYLDRI